MKAMRLLALAALALGLRPAARAQVVTAQPVFFTATAPVTLTFDASQGNRALNNFSGPVYIWTGVVTNASPNNTTWRHVKSPNFGQADPAALMTRSAANPNLYSITYTPSTFYPGVGTETILRLGMIFKDAAGTTVGRAADGGDIFMDVYQGGPAVRLTTPGSGTSQVVAAGTAVPVSGISAQAATLTIRLNGVVVAASGPGATAFSSSVTPNLPGRNVVRLTATSGTTAVSDSAILVVPPVVTTAPLPAGAREGVTYLPGGTSVILALTAPGKAFIYAIGEFNNFQANAAGLMNRTADGNTWWVRLNGLTPGREYAYQYLVDGNLRVADPYTEKVLDPNNDRFIPAVTYPNLRPYPAGQNAGIMATFQTNQTPYVWQTTNFVRPAKADLIVYELHLRDFIARHDYQTLRDTLSYLQRLGVNCIELMPVNEFEGNDSWGYNPSFHLALDKYYGTKDSFKAFVDAAHARGMAVVLDVVLNHAFGQSPMYQLYSDGGGATADSPWFNRVATHPFNVGNDFDHESAFTRRYSKNVMDYWVNEYRVDGYRFDLSKGFTQRNSGSNVGLWGNYDQSRINIWNDYNAHMQANSPGTYVILEHFADNSEETVLANAGMMLWGNMHGDYTRAVRGASANFSGGYFLNRGWQQPGLITYMESHDEERLVVDALANGGNNGAGYNTRNLYTALKRVEMNAAFLLPIPGAKMIWQFGEVGYDVGINVNGRTGQKPIRWAYYTDSVRRRQLYGVFANLNALRKLPAYRAGTFSANLGARSKTMSLVGPNLNMVAVGNFGLSADAVVPPFTRPGRWYNYLTGDSIMVANVSDPVALQPGQYALYLDRRVRRSVALLGARPATAAAVLGLSLAPNPATSSVALSYELPAAALVQASLLDVLGRTVRPARPAVRQAAGPQSLTVPLDGLPAGAYLLRLQAGDQQQVMRLLVE